MKYWQAVSCCAPVMFMAIRGAIHQPAGGANGATGGLSLSPWENPLPPKFPISLL
jgi:hypothetical protein